MVGQRSIISECVMVEHHNSDARKTSNSGKVGLTDLGSACFAVIHDRNRFAGVQMPMVTVSPVLEADIAGRMDALIKGVRVALEMSAAGEGLTPQHSEMLIASSMMQHLLGGLVRASADPEDAFGGVGNGLGTYLGRLPPELAELAADRMNRGIEYAHSVMHALNNPEGSA